MGRPTTSAQLIATLAMRILAAPDHQASVSAALQRSAQSIVRGDCRCLSLLACTVFARAVVLLQEAGESLLALLNDMRDRVMLFVAR